LDVRISKRLHELLLLENTGTREQLSGILNISERSVCNYISDMKTEIKAAIEYDKCKLSYYYYYYYYQGICGLCFESN
jgi:hypothetical protein